MDFRSSAGALRPIHLGNGMKKLELRFVFPQGTKDGVKVSECKV
jgi:hypothetical protein